MQYKYDIIDYLPVFEQGIFDYIYRPNDDSYLFLDALHQDIENIIKLDPWIVYEIGCGSGILINNLAFWLKNQINFCQFFASDINFDACEFSQKFSNHYNNEIQFFNDNIANSLKKRLINKVDVIICNPPYVPTEEEELKYSLKQIQQKSEYINNTKKNDRQMNLNCIDASYAGGKDGMEITYKMIDEAAELLSFNGIFYLLLIEENLPQKVVEYLNQKGFQKNEVLLKKKFHNEVQYIYKFQKS